MKNYQKPAKPYLIIGSGKVSKHISHYFNLIEIPFLNWHRGLSTAHLEKLLFDTDKILLLISDSSIKDFIDQHLVNFNGQIIHFSGALEIKGAISTHPLMSFTNQLYDLETYKKISFITCKPILLKNVLPELSNPSFQIDQKDKALYHALCVYSGNFTTLLWQESIQRFSELGIAKQALLPYMQQIIKNLEIDDTNSLTGPIARKDYVTLQLNRKSLTSDKMKSIFDAFVESYL